jgi:hypothetical protein
VSNFNLHAPAVVATLLVAGLTASAAASAAERTWYVGASADNASVDVQRSNDPLAAEPYDYGSTKSGHTAFAGVRLTKHVAVELGAQRRASLRWTEAFAAVPTVSGIYDADTAFDASVQQIQVAGILPFGKRWEAYIRGGFAAYRLSGTQILTDDLTGVSQARPVSARGHDYPLGFGVGATLREHWHLFFDISGLNIPKSFIGATGASAWIDSSSIGVQYRFGRRADENTATKGGRGNGTD